MSGPDFLQRIPLFAVLEPYELEQVLETTAAVTVSSGEFLFRRGDRGDALYIVETGLVEAVIDEGTPSERTLNSFFPGDFFGEMALLTQEPRSASVRAVTDSRLIRLSHEEFARLLERKPSMALHLSKVLSKYLSRSNAHLSRRAARISAVIPSGGGTALTHALAVRLLDSLERQLGSPAILVALGDGGFPGVEAPDTSELGAVMGGIRSLASGGHVLVFGDKLLQSADDLAMLSVINSLRINYGHILVWAEPSEALQRLSFLTRIDQTFLLSGCPGVPGEPGLQLRELERMLQGGVRTAVFTAGNEPLPRDIRPSAQPPIRLAASPGADGGWRVDDGSVDRLARAMAGLTVGLALGSGTAQGLSHLGVMKAMLEAGIPIDLIAGTSGGALYGSMVASGLTIAQSVENVVRQTRRNLIDKLDFAFPSRGLIRGNRIERMVRSCIGDVTFAELPIPLCAVAADLDTGEEVLIDDGIVYRGVRASISVPGIFEPYPLNGRLLIDGVVVNPLPVSVARSMGADIVIAVQVPAPGKVSMEAGALRTAGGRKRQAYSIVSSIVRSHHFVGERLADKMASEADVFIKPDVTRFGWREYRAAPDIIEAGYQAGQAALGQIRGMLGGSYGSQQDRG